MVINSRTAPGVLSVSQTLLKPFRGFNTLPVELFNQIMRHTDGVTVLTMKLVCKDMRKAVNGLSKVDLEQISNSFLSNEASDQPRLTLTRKGLDLVASSKFINQHQLFNSIFHHYSTLSHDTVIKIAGNQFLHPLGFLALSQKPDEKIRLAIAQNPGTPSFILKFMAKFEKNDDILLNIAENTATPPEVLKMLYSSTEDSDIIASLAENPHTPADVLAQMCSDHDDEFIHYILARNPDCDSITLKTLAQSDNKDVVDAVAGHLNADEATLRSIFDTAGCDITLSSLASNSHLPPDLLRMLSSSIFSLNIRNHLAKNPAIPHDVLQILINDPLLHVSIAVNPKTPQEVLHQLAVTGNIYVKSAVASNPNISHSTQVELAKSKQPPSVRAALSHNLNLVHELIDLFSIDKDPDIRAAVGLRPGIDLNILKKLSRDENPDVLQSVVSNPGIDNEIISHFLNLKESALDNALINNPSVQRYFLQISNCH